MKLPLQYLRSAQRDLTEAFDWYEKQQRGLGARFVGAVQREIDQIIHQPQLRGLIHADIRCGRVRRFPYSIFYRVQSDRIEIIAILHSHRDPQTWQTRIDD